MAKIRLSANVDSDLLVQARALSQEGSDSGLLEAVLREFIAKHRRAEIDAQYDVAYAVQPVSNADEWGDLSDWHAAAQMARR